MASEIVDIKWEWPAGRTVADTVLVHVQSVQPASRGFFGIKASPSLADALPEATVVVARVDEQSHKLAGQRLSLRLPGVEARKLEVGGWAAVGLLGESKVCVCVAASQARSAEEAMLWLATAPGR